MDSELGRGARVLALAACALTGPVGTALAQRPAAAGSARAAPAQAPSRVSAPTPRAGSRDTAQAADTSRAPATAPVVRLDVAGLPAPGLDPLSALVGRAPGLLIRGTSGRPGAMPGVLLAGVRSPASSGTSQPPLYVVDGVTVYAGMPAIDALEIVRADVVTGISAAPRYGARAANGAILLTTRSGAGSARAFEVRFRSEAGASDVERGLRTSRRHALLTDTGGRFCVVVAAAPLCARTVDWTTETARVNDWPGDSVATPPAFPLDRASSTPPMALRQGFASKAWPTPVYDALRQVTATGPLVRTAADVAGRVGGTAWLAGVSQVRERGSMRSLDGATRYTARATLDQRLGRTLALSLRGWYGHDRSDGFSQQDEGTLFTSLTLQPASADLLARDTTGRLYARTNLLEYGRYYGNPLLYTTGDGITDALATDRLLGGASLRWTPREWLDVEAAYGYDRRSDRWDYAVPFGFRAPGGGMPPGMALTQAERWRDATRTVSLEATARRSFGADLATTWTVRVLSERHSSSARYDDAYLTPGAAGRPPDTAYAVHMAADAPQRLSGLFGGASFAYRGRYAADVQLRRDAYTLGDQHPPATLARAGLAWRASEEPWWPLPAAAGAFSLRASLGRAGSPPLYPLTAPQLLDTLQPAANLRGPTVTERSVGADLELFRRVGVSVTWTRSDTKDLALPVPIVSTPTFPILGLANVGSLRGSSWELSLDVPLVRRRELAWTWRLAYDRSRAEFGKMVAPPFMYGGSIGMQPGGSYLLAREGERYGMLYGRYFLRGTGDCVRLPAPFSADCGGPGSSFQVNSDGWLVWVGKDAAGRAFSTGDGLARNLWMTSLPAASAPWGVALDWGMPVPLSDTTGSTQQVPLGSVVPTWHFSVSQDLTWRRWRVFALLEGVMGRHAWNSARGNAWVSLTDAAVDQRGVDPATAKPIGYYMRGLGGAYLGSGPSNAVVEDASYAKLREVSVTYHLGRVGGVGSWDVALIGRNVVTLTPFHGLDPESGISGGIYATGVLDVGAAYTFPTLRTFSLALSTTF